MLRLRPNCNGCRRQAFQAETPEVDVLRRVFAKYDALLAQQDGSDMPQAADDKRFSPL